MPISSLPPLPQFSMSKFIVTPFYEDENSPKSNRHGKVKGSVEETVNGIAKALKGIGKESLVTILTRDDKFGGNNCPITKKLTDKHNIHVAKVPYLDIHDSNQYTYNDLIVHTGKAGKKALNKTKELQAFRTEKISDTLWAKYLKRFYKNERLTRKKSIPLFSIKELLE